MDESSLEEQIIEQFESAWQAGPPERLRSLVAEVPEKDHTAILARLVQLDLMRRWEACGQSSQLTDETLVGDDASVGPPQLEEYLAEFDELNSPGILQQLIKADVESRKRIGDTPAIDDYAHRFPEVTLPIMPAGDSKPGGAPSNDTVLHDTATPGPFELPPRRIASYDLLEELGAGGMGVVYKARQLGTDRIVALKLLKTDQWGAARGNHSPYLERFRIEARATGRLEHPGIVRIYEVGEFDGMPYYSMQYVDGLSLAELVNRGGMSQREAARYLEQSARAVQEAHDCGILHRDLKPHNIMIDRRTDAACVADFGLAKMIEEDSASTREGEVLGTPAFMAPEQARDSLNVSTRADVYGLGATLYYLLTGHAPFESNNALQTLRMVIDENIVPPSKLNPAIDSDLEIICLKALEKEAARRYPSARALADDLAHWQAGEPISARPATRIERLVRWCRRNPVVAALSALLFLAMIAITVVSLMAYVRVTAALAQSELSDRMARSTVHEFFTVISEDVLLEQPSMQPLRKDLLTRALRYYRRFLEIHKDDPDLRQELAETLYRTGRIVELIESSQAALEIYSDAETMQRRLLDEDKDDPVRIDALSNTLNAKAACLTNLGQTEAGLKAFDAARNLRHSLTEKIPDNIEYQRKLANSEMNLALAYGYLGEPEKARRHFQASLDTREPLLDDSNPDRRPLVRDQGMCEYNLANLELDFGDVKRADAALDRAIGIFSRLLKQSPDDFKMRERLANSHRLRGEQQNQSGNLPAADRSFRLAYGILKELATENPRVFPLKIALADVCLLEGNVLAQSEFLEDAENFFHEADGLVRQVLDKSGPTGKVYWRLARVQQSLAKVRLYEQRWTKAGPLLDEALKSLDEALKLDPGNAAYLKLQHEIQTIKAALAQQEKSF